MGDKRLLFSVTKNDFDIQFYRGTGSGGQKKNKTSSACRITHKETGISACCEEFREQSKNKAMAFSKLIKDKRFSSWISHKADVVSGLIKTDEEIELEVDNMMNEKYLKIEVL